MTKNVNDNDDSLAALRGQVGERQNHGCGPNPLLALGISQCLHHHHPSTEYHRDTHHIDCTVTEKSKTISP